MANLQLREDGGVGIMPQDQLFQDHPKSPLMLLQDHDADTLVFFGVPPRQVGQTWEDHKAMTHSWNTFHRMHSKNIKALDSPFFENLMGPTAQFRTARRWRNQNVLLGSKPEGIKYFLDLTPPSEGEEAVLLLTQLTCSSGILNWSKAGKKFGIPSILIAGQDDFTNEARPPAATSPKKPVASLGKKLCPRKKATDLDTKKPRIGNWEGVMPKPPAETVDEELDDLHPYPNTDAKWDDNDTGLAESKEDATSPIEPFIPLQYSQIRHWSAIERLLHAIEGKDPMLNSAPKIWTFFAIANYFDCAKHPKISGWLTAWLFGAPNWHFIQCNPEICYRIGLGIQSYDLIRAAFSLLVGEKVLSFGRRDECFRKGEPFNPDFSMEGRRLECLDEDEQTRIGHAAIDFRDRVRAVYGDLVGREMSWLDRCPSFQRLKDFKPRSQQETALTNQYMQKIKDFVRARIVYIMSADYRGDQLGLEMDPMSVREFYPSAKDPLDQYSELDEEERIFCRCFWLVLRLEMFTVGNSVYGIADDSEKTIQQFDVRRVRWSKLTRSLFADVDWRLLVVSRKDLCELGEKFMHDVNLSHEVGLKTDSNGKVEKKKVVFDLPYRIGRETPGASNSSRYEETSTQKPIDDTTAERSLFTTLPIRNAPTVNSTANISDVDLELQFLMDYDIDVVPKKHKRLSQTDKKDDTSVLPSGYTFTYNVLAEVDREIGRICDDMLTTPRFSGDGEALPTTLISNITCMSDAEWKYLELWAGGNDDKTGGVFNDTEVPAPEHGDFAGGKRGLSDSTGSSDGSGSEWSEMMSTVGRISHRADHGTATDTMTLQSVGTEDFDVRSITDAASSVDTATINDSSSFASDDLEEADDMATDEGEEEDAENNGEDDNDDGNDADEIEDDDWDMGSEWSLE